MSKRLMLTGAAAILAIAVSVPALAQDLGSKVGGAFTGAYKGLKEGMIDAYESGTKGAQGLWNKTTRELDKATGHAPAPATPSAPPGTGDGPVLNIQTELNAAGYAAGRPDGVYGPRTANAIRAYQANNGLPQDGQPSVALLDQMRAKRAGQPLPATAAPPPVPQGTTTGAAPVLPSPPQATAPQASGSPTCKPYQTKLIVDGKEQVTQGTACLQADGSWKPIN
jgi:peptidoglycan hydrolase-like protein with peptidoglycan-binding domain